MSQRNKPPSIYRNLSVQRIRGKDCLPQTLITQFQYTTNIPYSSLSSPQIYVFRGNGCYDPDQSGVGSQPIGYDDMTNFYTSYEAYASKIEIEIYNAATAAVTLACVPATDTGSAVDYLTTKAMPLGRTVIAGPKGSGLEVKRLVNYCRTEHVLGTKPKSDKQLGALFSANPSSQWYWPVVLESADQATSVSVNLMIVITYYVILTGRKVMPNS